MRRYICIHGHFYQPPRENPWLEAIEIQDSAHPYHDWNERINAECYAPNSASRILDDEWKIVDIVSNYSRISFNYGPTVLSWMETYSPDVYQAILDADKKSAEWRSGHGNALGQVYNHIIMPLANRRDKETQVGWGIRDFESRFERFPEGMWLAETAVDIETLQVLAEKGIRFTVLAPNQALRVRKLGTGKWKDVSGARIDPTMAYLCKLPSGRSIMIFFYNGPLSQAVAFEKLLDSGEGFAHRLLSGFSDGRNWPQIVNIATDGETYGHHHRFGDMALAYAIDYIEKNGMAQLTNYGEYLEKHPPTHEVQISENTSWSCVHGIERWRGNCGCNTGSHPDWTQEWRSPLRNSLDWLREQLDFRYEHKIKGYLKDPWVARNEYIDVILDRSEENIYRFIQKNAKRNLVSDDIIMVLSLLEMQRHSMLMYTSCGWFFDELSGIETIQVMQYAGRAIQLYELLTGDLSLEKIFLEKLSRAKSNLPELNDGANIYNKYVKSAMVDQKKVGVHFAVSSLFEEYTEKTGVYSYSVNLMDYQKVQSGHARLAVGRILITSEITWMHEQISFCVLHFGSHAINGGVRNFLGSEKYDSMKDEMMATFETGDFAEIVRLMDQHFGTHNYSLRDLFKDEQRKVLSLDISSTLEEIQSTYRSMYDNNKVLMGFLTETGMPIPLAFNTAAEFILNFDLQRAFKEELVEDEGIRQAIVDIKKWRVSIDTVELEFIVRYKLEELMERLQKNPTDIDLVRKIKKIIEMMSLLSLEVNSWHIQNIYFDIAKSFYKDMIESAEGRQKDIAGWRDAFRELGEVLYFNVSSVLLDE
jgi:alpha-amylase/alpha-mannosidase (GH57 family)